MVAWTKAISVNGSEPMLKEYPQRHKYGKIPIGKISNNITQFLMNILSNISTRYTCKPTRS